MSDHSARFVRHKITRHLLRSNRITGGGQKEEDIFRSRGYRDANEYWAEMLSDEMEATDFAELLYESQRAPLQNPLNFNDQNLERRIYAKLRDAIKTPKDWLKMKRASSGEKTDDLAHWKLDPRAAAEWLLTLPLHKDLVPAGLRDFLEPCPERAGGIVSRTPGRPSPMHLVKAEFERRGDLNAPKEQTAAVARSLRHWLIDTHPTIPPLSEKAIRNKVPGWREEMLQRNSACPKL